MILALLDPFAYLNLFYEIYLADIVLTFKRYILYEIITNKTLCDFFDFMVEMDKHDKESDNYAKLLWNWIIYPSYNITIQWIEYIRDIF